MCILIGGYGLRWIPCVYQYNLWNWQSEKLSLNTSCFKIGLPSENEASVTKADFQRVYFWVPFHARIKGDESGLIAEQFRAKPREQKKNATDHGTEEHQFRNLGLERWKGLLRNIMPYHQFGLSSLRSRYNQKLWSCWTYLVNSFVVHLSWPTF